ncbi:hypothetical protein RCL1_000974 [Eukaryota sp. TZLM3-RCL]
MSIAHIQPNHDIKSRLSGLEGISDDQLNQHFEVYEDHVRACNELLVQLNKARVDGRKDHWIQDSRRRVAFELNSVLLHEVFFSIIGRPSPMSDEFKETLTKHFGSVDLFLEELQSCATTRGVGWTVLFYDKLRDNMILSYVDLYQVGMLPLPIVCAFDHWEHGFASDFKGTTPDKAMKFFEALKKNIDWAAIEERFNNMNL